MVRQHVTAVALTVALGLVVAGSALSSGDRGLFALLGSGGKTNESRPDVAGSEASSSDDANASVSPSSTIPPQELESEATEPVGAAGSVDPPAGEGPGSEPAASDPSANDRAPVDAVDGSPERRCAQRASF